MTAAPTQLDPGASQSWLRPQSVVFTLLAEHLLGRRLALFSGSFIEVLDGLGISEPATRSTLGRMTRRGLLGRQRQGRKIYFHMTERCTRLLEGGRDRIWYTGAVNDSVDEAWTLLAFSLPEAWQRERHGLRSKLAWAGFGPMQSGVWLAPREVDVTRIVTELGLDEHVRVFRVAPASPTNPTSVIGETFDLDGIAQRYRDFIERWRAPPAGMRALTLTLRLSTQWLETIREDPRVPVHLLPRDWPAIEAETLFRTLHAEQFPAACAQATSVLQTIPAE